MIVVGGGDGVVDDGVVVGPAVNNVLVCDGDGGWRIGQAIQGN